jgi:hypothetical protein
MKKCGLFITGFAPVQGWREFFSVNFSAALAQSAIDERRAAGDGADEIDMVIDQGAFLSGERQKVSDEFAHYCRCLLTSFFNLISFSPQLLIMHHE